MGRRHVGGQFSTRDKTVTWRERFAHLAASAGPPRPFWFFLLIRWRV